MAIDLDEYRPAVRTSLKKGGFACVYVASVSGGRPCRVGYALDLPAAAHQLQRFSPLSIEIHDALWVPDRRIATTIAQTVQAEIYDHRTVGGWYNLTAQSVAGMVDLASFRLHPNAAMISHDELIARWARKTA